MKYFWPILLQLLAFGTAFAEVMIPSFGLLALLSVGLGGYSWFYIATELPRGAALGFALADLALIPLAIKFGFAYLGRSPVSHGSDLGHGSGFEDREKDLARLRAKRESELKAVRARNEAELRGFEARERQALEKVKARLSEISQGYDAPGTPAAKRNGPFGWG